MGEQIEVKKKRDYLLPASILVAALLVSTALVYNAGKNRGGDGTASVSGTLQGEEEETTGPSPYNIRPVGSDDHIYGDPNAPLKIVEFSDLECPFCKRFHPTMESIVSEYNGQVAWVYRHFPLDSIHPKARKEAEAAECAAEQGGNNAFWAYVSRLFEVTPSNNGLNLASLSQIARDVGLDGEKLQACVDSGKYSARVASDLEDAINSGARGTPYSVIITKDGKKFPFSGALPFEQVKTLVGQALE